MQNENVLASISKWGNGSINLGVVGAVRTGKSTFIKRFIENLVIPSVEDEYEKKKCLDEIPQSAQGKTIMTTEPKFVPSSGAKIKVDEFKANITLVDCVGYVVPEASGFLDSDGNPKMVKCPWFDDYIPLSEAAEIGTRKVITDHATIGIVVTTDGSITDISRESYVEAEDKVISELKEIGKPFIIVLNAKDPYADSAKSLKMEMEEKYEVPVILCSCENLKEREINEILKTALYEFPINEIKINIPAWINSLAFDNEIKKCYLEKIRESIINADKLKDADKLTSYFEDSPYIAKSYISEFSSADGIVTLNVDAPESLYEEVLLEAIGKEKMSKSSLLKMFLSYKTSSEELKYIKEAMKMANSTGYGVLHPTIKDMKLETPEIIKQGNKYGVKLKANASSIHMIRVNVESTFEPIIGSEVQSKELIDYIMKDYENDKDSIWQSEIFGRSLEQIVKEGIEAKLAMMPENTRYKLANTVTKIVNKGANNLIAFVI